ncbi:translocation/assembly module TamB domain-containing protein [Halopseudomonas pachastrellae]|nr:translocation/assembly module TamB domain-containing protein [Halopseudomonas pachastrellae]
MDLQLRGSALPVNVEPYAQLQVAPDLAITLRETTCMWVVSWRFPKEISACENCRQARVTVSPDVVIVGQEAAEQDAGAVSLPGVKLNIGDQLRLSAFGLRGRLKGQLEVQENLTANGDLQILDGKFRRLGQELELRRALLLFSGADQSAVPECRGHSPGG